MANKDPFNISLLDIDRVIRDEHLQEVTSEFIRESSSNRFHPEGLFSEQIFGEVASQKRLETCGYIKLNCHVFHPIIYQNLRAIRKFYTEIMAGTTYAIWDADEGDFVRAAETELGADTGFSFFMKHFDKIDFEKNNSLKRNDKIDVIKKYKTLRIIDKIIVIPAGVRDMQEDQGKMEKDSINSLYASLMRNAKSMTKGADTNPLFDSVHYTIQKRVIEIYEHVATVVRGKRGFFEGKYSHRNIARGTRNVVTASDMDASDPESPQYHKCDECKVPLFQAAKAAANYLVYWYKTLFYDQIANMSSENIPLIDPKTLRLEYVTLEMKDKDRMLTAEGIEKTIDRFRDPFNRFKPVVAMSNNKPYYLYMVYDQGDRIALIRNVDEFKQSMKDNGKTFDEAKLRPLTQAEMLYIACYAAYRGVHATCTRYPVTDEQSIFVSNTHLMSTSPARIVRLCRGVVDEPDDILLPEYPIEGAKFIDALMLHPTRLKSLNADFDGNCLVGETKIEIRYTKTWFESVCHLLKNPEFYNPGKEGYSDQNTPAVMTTIDARVHAVNQGFNYAEIRLDEVPQLGKYLLDKNGARVYDLQNGLEVLSIRDGSPIYLPVTKVTVEDDCKVIKINGAGNSAIVSTNPSLAVFDHLTGCLAKVSPDRTAGKYIPVIMKATQFNVDRDQTGEDGYNAAYCLDSITEMHTWYLSGMSQAYQLGYLSGIVDKFGSVKKSLTLLGIDVSITAQDADESDILRKMLYVIGIRYLGPVAGSTDSKVDIRLNCHDVLKYRSLFIFKNKKNKDAFRIWRPIRSLLQHDVIPVTTNELSHLGKLAVTNKRWDDMYKFSHSKTKAFERELLKKYVSCNEDSPLAKRVYSETVMWTMISTKRVPEKRRVYDLIVPDSKVFAVNSGMIVYDTCSWIPIFSEESNKECEDYIHTAGNYILPSGEPLAEMCDDLVKVSFFAMSRDVPELKK